MKSVASLIEKNALLIKGLGFVKDDWVLTIVVGYLPGPDELKQLVASVILEMARERKMSVARFVLSEEFLSYIDGIIEIAEKLICLSKDSFNRISVIQQCLRDLLDTSKNVEQPNEIASLSREDRENKDKGENHEESSTEW